MKANKTMRGQEILNHREERTSNQRVTLIQLHTLKFVNNKNNSMAGFTTYLSILTLNVNGLNFPNKRHDLAN
jgi:hypothetical protein